MYSTYSDVTVICCDLDVFLVDIIELILDVSFEEFRLVFLLSDDGDGEVEQQDCQAVLGDSDESPHGWLCSL